jgi:hypothetical protein
MQAVGLAGVNDPIRDSLASALAPAEYGYFFVIFCIALGGALGLTLMADVGGGFLMVVVLGLCVIALGPSFMTVLQTTWIPLACGASYLFIQLVLHEESIYGAYVHPFALWLVSLVIVQTLAMYRSNFLHRFAWFTVFIAVAMLPYMSMGQGKGYERLSSGGAVAYGHINQLGSWFGFCVLYLTIKGFIETRRAYRLAAWLMAVGFLYALTLTVSRGALIATIASLLVASRRLVKNGVLPILLFAVLLVGFMEIGVFDQGIQFYSRRAGEETGRLTVWPLVIERILNSPLIGVGASNPGGVTSSGSFISAHNGFLFLAVASGIFPFTLFCAYCFRSGMAARRSNDSDGNSAFYLPLVTYAVLIISTGNLEFMLPWAIVSLALPIANSISRMNEATREPRISSLRADRVR